MFGNIQITNDGYSTVSFIIENKNIISQSKNMRIALVIDLEDSENAKESFESRSGLSLHKFSEGEKFSGSYIIEDYYVEVKDFQEYANYLSDPSSNPPLGDNPEDLSYYDIDAYSKENEIFLNVFSNIRGYNLDVFSEVKKAKFVFFLSDDSDRSNFINQIQGQNTAFFETKDLPFKLPPYISKPGILRIDDSTVTPNQSGFISEEIKDEISKIYGEVQYKNLSSESLFRLNKFTKNPIIIIANYNDGILKSKYNLYVNDKKYPVSKRVVTRSKDKILFIINLKNKYEDSGNFNFVVKIEDDFVFTSSNEYANATIDLNEDETSELTRLATSTFILPEHLSSLSSSDSSGEKKIKFKLPARIKALSGKFKIFGSIKKKDSDHGDLSEESNIFVDMSPGEEPQDGEAVNPEEALATLSEEEAQGAGLFSGFEFDFLESKRLQKISNIAKDTVALGKDIVKYLKEPCGKLNLSKKSVLQKVMEHYEDKKTPISSENSSFFNEIVTLNPDGFTAFFPSGTEIPDVRTTFRYDGTVIRRAFFRSVVSTNNVSSNPKIISINGQTDFSEIEPSQVENIVLLDPAEAISIAINNITIEASSLYQNTASLDMSDQTKLKLGEQSNLVLDCNSKISVVRPDPIVSDTPDIPDAEDPCKEKRERGSIDIPPFGPGLSFAGISLENPIENIGDLQSFCDFSFSLTGELKLELKGFEKVLSVIKVIFCIVDVLCSLTNPKKYFSALVRLFECLWELIALLPQVSVPIMFYDLLVHIVELLKCVFDKIAYYIIATEEIISSFEEAWNNQDLASVYNLEQTLSRHLLSFEVELDVLRPVFDIIDIFKQLLNIIFNLPCQLNFEESELDFFCVDNTIASAIIADKINNPNNLIMFSQTYTTEETGRCGNTPPFKNASEKESLERSDGKIKRGLNTDCSDEWDTSDGRVLMYPDEFSGKNILDLQSAEPMKDVDMLSYRVKNSDFEGTFKVSATKIIKAPFTNNIDSVFSGNRSSNRVYISFGNKLSLFGNPDDEVNPKGLTDKSAFYRIPISRAKNISLNDNLDDALGFAVKSGESVVVGNANSGSVFSAFSESNLSLKGNKQDGMHPEGLLVEFGGETVSYSNIPSFMIVDEDGDVYVVEENGIKFDERGFIKGIFAILISDNNSVSKSFSKEDEVLVVSQETLDAQSNFEVIKEILIDNNISFSNSRHGRKTSPPGGYAKFIRDLESLPNSIQSIEGRMVNPEEGAYDFLGGTSDEIEEFQDAVQLSEVFRFVDIYFVDIASTVEELIVPCETQAQSLDNLEVPSVDEVLDNINATEDCINDVRNYVLENNNKIRESIENGEVPENPYSLSDMYKRFENATKCIDDIILSVCSQATSYLATSFRIESDSDEIPRSEEYISGLGPSFTGAIEYASGIGDYISTFVEEEVKVLVIPRDIYNNEFSSDFSERISIVIEKDDTASAEISEIKYDAEISGSFFFVSSKNPGSVVISCEICGKSVKALTYDGASSEYIDNDCTVINSASLTSDLALGAVRTIKRTLEIRFEPKTSGARNTLPDGKINKSSDALKTGINYGE
jgi:hypothetical protein